MSRRGCGVVSLALIGLYALAVEHAAVRSGSSFQGFSPLPLGGGAPAGGPLLCACAVALLLLLGWGIPGLSLAQLSGDRLDGVQLLGRGLGLGVGYLLLTCMGHTLLLGHTPPRAVLLALLALPSLACVVRGGGQPCDPRPLATGLALMLALTGVFWGKLRHEGMNGDGTESYELARSLETHALPHWDLERWEPPGRFGIPLVNPFVTNSYLVRAGMTLAGRGEIAARMPLIPALVLAGLLAAAGLGKPTRGVAWVYVGSVLAVYCLWNAYYVGYEPAFTDLAEPAATDTLMVALWLAGFVEVARGRLWIGLAALVLSAGVLYSSPILTTIALLGLATGDGKRRALALWLAALASVVAAMLLVGAATGDVGDWIRQTRSEYWSDFTDPVRRTPVLPFLGAAFLLTGGLPLCIVSGWRRLSPAARSLLAAALTYLAIVLLSSYKNLHYLAPLPFLLIPPALECSRLLERLVATGVALCALALSWPSSLAIHRETIELGRVSCVSGLDYEAACLNGDVVYDVFGRPGTSSAFTVGKHTFVRYALDLGGAACVFRLSPSAPRGWTLLAQRGTVVLSTRDPGAHDEWRRLRSEAPRSFLFPSSAR
jgi:hypothetical protein